jgi:hypothetical protein
MAPRGKRWCVNLCGGAFDAARVHIETIAPALLRIFEDSCRSRAPPTGLATFPLPGTRCSEVPLPC